MDVLCAYHIHLWAGEEQREYYVGVAYGEQVKNEFLSDISTQL